MIECALHVQDNSRLSCQIELDESSSTDSSSGCPSRRPDARPVRGASHDQKLEGKVAIITGSASGIGAACASAFAREGARSSSPTSTSKGAERHAATLKAGRAVRRLPSTSTSAMKRRSPAIFEATSRSSAASTYCTTMRRTRGSRARATFRWNRPTSRSGTASGASTCAAPCSRPSTRFPRLRARGGGSIVNTASGSAFTRACSRTRATASSRRAS